MILGFGGLLKRSSVQRYPLRIGYLPTLDAAPLLIAQARGLFEQQRLDVSLQRQTSWLRASQKLGAGELEAAHLPGTLPLVAELGIHGFQAPLRTACVLAHGGSSFALRPEVMEALRDDGLAEGGDVVRLCEALQRLVQRRAASGAAKLRFAVSDPYDNGSYDLRYCLAAVGVDPAEDVQIVPITPGRVIKSLRSGKYDGAWLDEPFASLAAKEGLVELCFSKHAVWNHSQSKVLAVRESFVRRHPKEHRALLKAVLLAALWAESHRAEAAELLAGRQGLGVDAADLDCLINGAATFCGQHAADITLANGAANFPWYSQAVWYLGQMIRWGDYDQVLDFKKTAQTVYLPKHYREAAREIDLPHPSIGYKNEGEHADDWLLEEASQPLTLGPDLFFDRSCYKPRQTMKYLNGLKISHISAPLDAMWAIR